MLDITLEEKLIEKVGGKFKLTTLLQKRLVELNRGARPLVKTTEKKPIRIVVQEILEDKIELVHRDEIKLSLEEEAGRLEGTETQRASDVLGSEIKRIKEQRIKELADLLNPKS